MVLECCSNNNKDNNISEFGGKRPNHCKMKDKINYIRMCICTIQYTRQDHRTHNTCVDVSAGFGGSSESGSIPKWTVLCSSGAAG